MDIKIDRHYYYLKMLDGAYHIFLREQIVSSPLSVTQLGLCFDNQDDAEECVEKLNRPKEDGSH